MGAADYLGLHARTLDNWRSQGRGPRYVRVGRRIVYRIADLESYLDARTVEVAG
jgi:predicted DNA-binding transcriptional regulator AlpA